MRRALVAIPIALSSYAPLSSAANYSVDPEQSYISVRVPAWERGEPWVFVDLEGNEIAGGYLWRSVKRDETYTLSGVLGLSALPWTPTTYFLDSTNVVSGAPDELPFSLPSYLNLDTSSGALTSCTFCGVSGGYIMQYGFGLAANGVLSGTSVVLDGVRPPPYYDFLVGVMLGGYEPPYSLDFSYAGAWYSYHIVASVPEPESFTLLLAGLGVVGAVARYRSRS